MSYPLNVAELCFTLVPESNNLDLAAFGEQDGVGYILHWDTDRLGPQPTELEVLAVTQQQVNAARLAKLRNAAKQFQNDQQAQNVAFRSLVKLIVDENNLLRQWIADFKAVTAAAGSLNALKTGVAGLPNVPQRTYQQAKNALNSLVDAD